MIKARWAHSAGIHCWQSSKLPIKKLSLYKREKRGSADRALKRAYKPHDSPWHSTSRRVSSPIRDRQVCAIDEAEVELLEETDEGVVGSWSRAANRGASRRYVVPQMGASTST